MVCRVKNKHANQTNLKCGSAESRKNWMKICQKVLGKVLLCNCKLIRVYTDAFGIVFGFFVSFISGPIGGN